MSDRNEITLRGTVISLNANSKNAILGLAVGTERGITNFPGIIFYDPLKLEGIGVRKRVLIHAHTQNRVVIHKDSNKRTSRTIIVGDSIELAKRRLLEAFSTDVVSDEEGGMPADINDVVLEGDVVSVYIPPDKKENIVVLRLEMLDESSGNTRQCDLSCFNRQADIGAMLSKGDRVAAVGIVSTSFRKNGNERRFFQNIICKDIYPIKTK